MWVSRASPPAFRETSYSLDLLIGDMNLAGYEQQLPDISYRQEKRAFPNAGILSNSKTLIQLLSEKIKFFVVESRSFWYDDVSGDD